MGIRGSLPDLRMPTGQQQGVWVAYLRFDQPQVAGGIEKTRIPALPVGQQLFDLVTEIHRPNVYEPVVRYNDVFGGSATKNAGV